MVVTIINENLLDAFKRAYVHNNIILFNNEAKTLMFSCVYGLRL